MKFGDEIYNLDKTRRAKYLGRCFSDPESHWVWAGGAPEIWEQKKDKPHPVYGQSASKTFEPDQETT